MRTLTVTITAADGTSHTHTLQIVIGVYPGQTVPHPRPKPPS